MTYRKESEEGAEEINPDGLGRQGRARQEPQLRARNGLVSLRIYSNMNGWGEAAVFPTIISDVCLPFASLVLRSLVQGRF